MAVLSLGFLAKLVDSKNRVGKKNTGSYSYKSLDRYYESKFYVCFSFIKKVGEGLGIQAKEVDCQENAKV